MILVFEEVYDIAVPELKKIKKNKPCTTEYYQKWYFFPATKTFTQPSAITKISTLTELTLTFERTEHTYVTSGGQLTPQTV